jgi:hypothetical protein
MAKVKSFTCLIFRAQDLPATISHILAADAERAKELAQREFKESAAVAAELWEGSALLWSEPPGEEL